MSQEMRSTLILFLLRVVVCSVVFTHTESATAASHWLPATRRHRVTSPQLPITGKCGVMSPLAAGHQEMQGDFPNSCWSPGDAG